MKFLSAIPAQAPVLKQGRKIKAVLTAYRHNGSALDFPRLAATTKQMRDLDNCPRWKCIVPRGVRAGINI